MNESEFNITSFDIKDDQIGLFQYPDDTSNNFLFKDTPKSKMGSILDMPFYDISMINNNKDTYDVLMTEDGVVENSNNNNLDKKSNLILTEGLTLVRINPIDRIREEELEPLKEVLVVNKTEKDEEEENCKLHYETKSKRIASIKVSKSVANFTNIIKPLVVDKISSRNLNSGVSIERNNTENKELYEIKEKKEFKHTYERKTLKKNNTVKYFSRETVEEIKHSGSSKKIISHICTPKKFQDGLRSTVTTSTTTAQFKNTIDHYKQDANLITPNKIKKEPQRWNSSSNFANLISSAKIVKKITSSSLRNSMPPKEAVINKFVSSKMGEIFDHDFNSNFESVINRYIKLHLDAGDEIENDNNKMISYIEFLHEEKIKKIKEINEKYESDLPKLKELIDLTDSKNVNNIIYESVLKDKEDELREVDVDFIKRKEEGLIELKGKIHQLTLSTTVEMKKEISEGIKSKIIQCFTPLSPKSSSCRKKLDNICFTLSSPKRKVDLNLTITGNTTHFDTMPADLSLRRASLFIK